MTAPLRGIAQHVPDVTRRILVHLGPRAMRLGKVEALPLAQFLAELPS